MDQEIMEKLQIDHSFRPGDWGQNTWTVPVSCESIGQGLYHNNWGRWVNRRRVEVKIWRKNFDNITKRIQKDSQGSINTHHKNYPIFEEMGSQRDPKAIIGWHEVGKKTETLFNNSRIINNPMIR